MDSETLAKHWVESSEESFRVMTVLFENKEYTSALFFGHLYLEKLLKGLYAKINTKEPEAPFVHDLVFLARKCNLELDVDMRQKLGLINSFNIAARYDVIKKNFYKLCTKDFANQQIKIIKEVGEWLKKLIKK